MVDYFKFEDKDRDFPYYKHNPKISKNTWIILLMSVLIAFGSYVILYDESEFFSSIVFCLLMLIPLLYYSNWDYSLIFQKPTKNHVKLAFIMFIGYIIYATVMGEFIDLLGWAAPTDIVDTSAVDIESIVSLIFSMMGEELVKFIPLMVFLRLIYKYTNNRKLSIIISSFIVMMCFGLLHYSGSVAEVLLLQGLGSVFEFYGYIKTKNVFVPYMSHLFTDVFLFTLMLIV